MFRVPKYIKIIRLLPLFAVVLMTGVLIFESDKPNYDSDVKGAQVSTSVSYTGATLTQYSLDDWGNSTAISTGKNLLNNSTSYVAQHLMGFGTVSPVTSESNFNNNIYSWNGLDKRINVVMSGTPNKVLTACCAPNWIKGTASDFGTDSNGKQYIEYAPLPQYYDEYATIIAKAVERYPSIKYVQVWNEMKGFWDSGKNRWNYEGYTQLYNQIYTKVKAVRPSVKIGGPYVVIGSNGNAHSYNSTSLNGTWGWADKRDMDVLTYWLANKAGADFIALDIKNKNRDGKELVDIYQRMDKFQAVADWVRTLSGSSGLPIWWSEWYSRTDSTSDSAAYKNSVMTYGLIKNVKAGIYTSMMWGPQGDSSGNSEPLALFTDTRNSGGGQATLFYTSQKYINDYFSAGTTIQNINSGNGNIEVLVSNQRILAVNKSSSSQSSTVASVDISLAGYQVRLFDLPVTSSGSASGNTTSSPTSSGSNNDTAGNTSTTNPSGGAGTNTNGNSEPSSQTGQNADESEYNRTIAEDATKIVGSLVSDGDINLAGKSIPTRPIKIFSLLLFIGATSSMIVFVVKHRHAVPSYTKDPDIFSIPGPKV